MIYQPRNVKPSSKAIDATLDNTFSMEMQTNTFVSAYQLYISDFSNQDVYTGEKIGLDTVLYNGDVLNIPVSPDTSNLSNGNNYKWRVKLFQPLADMTITYGTVQNEGSETEIYLQPNINIKVGMKLSINNELKTIQTYSSSTGIAIVDSAFSIAPTPGTSYQILSDFIETVPDYVFYACKNPDVSINNVPSTLTLKYHNFTGVYNQPDNIPIVYHRFILYINNSDGTKSVIDDTGNVYSANLSYIYDAFRTGNSYSIQMIVENDMGIISTTEVYSFDVEYEIVEYLQQPVATFDSEQNAIDVTWVTPVEHDAELLSVTDGSNVSSKLLYNVPYSTSNTLYTDEYIAKWSSEDGLCVLPDDFNITLQFSPDSNFFYDINGVYNEIVPFIEGQTDNAEDNGNFTISIDKNTLVFEMKPDISFQVPFYTGITQVFVNSPSSVPQINNDYIWMDSGTWDDNGYWVEGGTSLERICNHWWKIQITKDGIKIEEIFPNN